MDGINQLIESIRRIIKKETNAYDTTATVRRIEGDTAWVHIPGGVDETPVKLTIAASAGDNVQVRVSGGKAFLVGNGSAPPTDDTAAIISRTIAIGAQTAADDAKETAEAVEGIAASAQAAAARADKAATRAEGKADDAAGAATSAQQSADSAANSASLALNQLDIVENVVGVLDLLAKNGTYQLTSDTEVQDSKWYFTYDGDAYQVVSNPTGDPSAQGWYELTGINEAVQNYVSSHLVLDNSGLWLQSDGSSAKLQLSPSGGVIIYNENNQQVAQYGADTVIGDPTGFNIKIIGGNNEIGFYEGSNKIAYMSGSALYVANRLSFGHFQLIERNNGHFTLKLIS